MKKICMICIFLLFSSVKTAAITPEDDLERLATIVINSQLEIDMWQVTIKEKMPINKVGKIMKQLEETHTLTVENTKDFIKYTLHNNNIEIISEAVEIIIEHTNNVEYAHFNAIIEGSDWNNNILAIYQNRILSLNRHFFSEISRKYICLSTTNNAIIKGVDFIKQINDELDVIHKSTQLDTESYSTYEQIVYGYSPLLKETIQVEHKPMNLQIVTKQIKNNQTKLTIGTPILLNEY